MNYLELVQKAIYESGAHLTVPDTLVGLDGLQARFAEWVRDAWVEIQLERNDWQFRQFEKAVTLDPLTLDNEMIAPPSLLAAELEEDWRMILLRDVYIHDPNDLTVPSRKLHYVSWRQWPIVFGRTDSRQAYNVTENTAGEPRWFTVAPDGNMYVHPRPDKTYQIQFFAPKKTQELEINTDEPFLDREYRLAIVYRALMEYSLYHDDRSVFERARNKWRSYKKALEHKYMPDVSLVTHQMYRNV